MKSWDETFGAGGVRANEPWNVAVSMFLRNQTYRPSRDGIVHAVAPSHVLSWVLKLNPVFVVLVWSMFDARRCLSQVEEARSDSRKYILHLQVFPRCLAQTHLRAGSPSRAAELHSSTSTFFCTFHQVGFLRKAVVSNDPPSRPGDA